MLLVYDFSSIWNTLQDLIQMTIYLHLCQISNEQCSCEEKIIINDDVFVHNMQLALTTYLLAC